MINDGAFIIDNERERARARGGRGQGPPGRQASKQATRATRTHAAPARTEYSGTKKSFSPAVAAGALSNF